METIILSWEDAESNGNFSNWLHDNEIDDILSLFEGDPDLLKIDCSQILFIDIETKEHHFIIYLDCEYEVENERIEQRLKEFFSADYKELFENPEKNTWDTFNGNSDIIAYRGGSGYVYTLWAYIAA